MATLRQIEANRRNAKSSTGPRTAPGKSASRMNALKSGIDAKSTVITGEKPADLEALALEYHDRFHPQTPEERFLVDTLVSSDWLLRRLRKAEAQIWDEQMDSAHRYEPQNPLGYIAAGRAGTFSRLQRRLDSLERSYHRALDKLQKIQSARPEPPPQPQPEIGFVPQEHASEASHLPPAPDPRAPSPRFRALVHSTIACITAFSKSRCT